MKNRIILPSPVLDMRPDNFEYQLKGDGGTPVVVGYFSQSCPYSRRATPIFGDLAKRFNGSVRFGLVDVSVYPEVLRHIDGWRRSALVPGFMMVSSGGEVIAKYVGMKNPAAIDAFVALQTGMGCTQTGMFQCVVLQVFHYIVGKLILFLRFIGIEPTDANRFPGGTVGKAGICLGIAVAVLILAICCCCCCCCCRKTGSREKGAQKEE